MLNWDLHELKCLFPLYFQFSVSTQQKPRKNPVNRACEKMAIARTGVFVDDYLECMVFILLLFL